MCVMTHSYVCHDTNVFTTELDRPWPNPPKCDTIHSYAPHNSLMCVPWLIHIYYRDGAPFTKFTNSGHGSFVCVTRLNDTCAVTHSYVCHDWFIFTTELERPLPNSRNRGMAHLYVRHESLMAWLICMCDTSHWYICHDSFIQVQWLIHIYYRTREQHNEFAQMWRICKMRLWGHGIFIYVQWPIHTNVPWLIHTCTMTNLILLLITTHSCYLLQN